MTELFAFLPSIGNPRAMSQEDMLDLARKHGLIDHFLWASDYPATRALGHTPPKPGRGRRAYQGAGAERDRVFKFPIPARHHGQEDMHELVDG